MCGSSTKKIITITIKSRSPVQAAIFYRPAKKLTAEIDNDRVIWHNESDKINVTLCLFASRLIIISFYFAIYRLQFRKRKIYQNYFNYNRNSNEHCTIEKSPKCSLRVAFPRVQSNEQNVT